MCYSTRFHALLLLIMVAAFGIIAQEQNDTNAAINAFHGEGQPPVNRQDQDPNNSTAMLNGTDTTGNVSVSLTTMMAKNGTVNGTTVNTTKALTTAIKTKPPPTPEQPTPASVPETTTEASGLGMGVIIGIAAGALILVAAIGGAVYFFVFRKKSDDAGMDEDLEQLGGGETEGEEAGGETGAGEEEGAETPEASEAALPGGTETALSLRPDEAAAAEGGDASAAAGGI